MCKIAHSNAFYTQSNVQVERIYFVSILKICDKYSNRNKIMKPPSIFMVSSLDKCKFHSFQKYGVSRHGTPHGLPQHVQNRRKVFIPSSMEAVVPI